MPHTTPSVRASWNRIDAWLRTHAPESYARLAPPADPDQVAWAEQEMGLRFPPDLLESLACHNGLTGATGTVGPLPGKPPLTVEQIVARWRGRMELLTFMAAREHAGDDEAPDWHAQWIPWAESDGDAQVIDARDGATQGWVGTVFHDDAGIQDADWSSLGSYLHDVAEVLEHGGKLGRSVPYLTDGGELHWDLEGTTALGRTPLTPAPTTGTGPTTGSGPAPDTD
ncbi:SMI1/KNR4 family protein [Streptomyces boluensis]|uniref:Knr4/Smi1-like domain-containing protein n=1 Tax=Streptomyces boluensis TaxID=1775135 RepID=A0A964XLT7_9ACTN|nr:SMI1/KNR4 family protein [Streptomyces boluensis]NBE53680.1 hypothetical protein [Streptomyces boluensis]